MNRPGLGPQSLRGIPNTLYQNQQSNTGRTGSIPSNRLQNGKLANANSGWGFGIPPAGAPGLSGNHPRTNSNVLSGFAQSIGGSQPNTPLDPSEFPSLSGSSQSQLQNTNAQALWANPSIRAPQHTPVQRPQAQSSASHSQQTSLQSSQNQAQGHDEAGTNTNSKFSNDEFRFTTQGNASQAMNVTQTQTGDDDFPPLGGNGVNDLIHDRRSGIAQNTTFTHSDIASLNPNNNRISAAGESLQDRSMANIGGRGIHSINCMRSNLDGIRGGSGALSENDRNSNLSRPSIGGQQFSSSQQSSQLPFRDSGLFRDHPADSNSTHQPPAESNFGVDFTDASNQSAKSKTLSNMSEKDRWSLPGLLKILPQDATEHSSLAVGQDLTVLGLDLNRPDNSPLYPTFGSPFVEANGRPIIPEFRLPAAYTVSNVPPLHSKISNFSDETLFMIFYQYPRDILQEFAAAELYARNWRWHKVLRQWLTQDKMSGSPQHLSRQGERGWYIFFDVTGWRRERRQFDLNYNDLDQRHAVTNVVPL